jgi:hypothetical protein
MVARELTTRLRSASAAVIAQANGARAWDERELSAQAEGGGASNQLADSADGGADCGSSRCGPLVWLPDWKRSAAPRERQPLHDGEEEGNHE